MCGTTLDLPGAFFSFFHSLTAPFSPMYMTLLSAPSSCVAPAMSSVTICHIALAFAVMALQGRQ